MSTEPSEPLASKFAQWVVRRWPDMARCPFCKTYPPDRNGTLTRMCRWHQAEDEAEYFKMVAEHEAQGVYAPCWTNGDGIWHPSEPTRRIG